MKQRWRVMLVCVPGLALDILGAHELSMLTNPPEPLAALEISGRSDEPQSRCFEERVGGRKEVSCREEE